MADLVNIKQSVAEYRQMLLHSYKEGGQEPTVYASRYVEHCCALIAKIDELEAALKTKKVTSAAG